MTGGGEDLEAAAIGRSSVVSLCSGGNSAGGLRRLRLRDTPRGGTLNMNLSKRFFPDAVCLFCEFFEKRLTKD